MAASSSIPVFRNRLIALILINLVVAPILIPCIIFYGPFDTVRRVAVGTLASTMHYRWVPYLFLSKSDVEQLTTITASSGGSTPPGGVKPNLSTRSDKIEHRRFTGPGFVGHMLIVHDPLRIRVGTSRNIGKRGETTSAIAKRAGATAAINGGGFIDGVEGNGGIPLDLVIQDGQVLFPKKYRMSNRFNVIGMLRDGEFIAGDYSMQEVIDMGVKEALSFRQAPPLISNGKGLLSPSDITGGPQPRTALGQKMDGTMVLLVVDGRQLGYSNGAYYSQIQEILLKEGCITAALLDGGSSTTMVYQGEVVNRPSNLLGERAVPTAFIVK